ncbi:MAG: hypothetical protein II299_06640 [Alistipes sp.]|nr:hypothetical protein [Alistipes sp.]
MKRVLYYIACSLTMMFMACTNSDLVDTQPMGENKILITTLTGSSVKMRATVADTDSEAMVEWIDVFIFDESENKVHSERINKQSNPDIGGGTFSISKARNTFTAGARYWVFLIANSSVDLQSQNITDLDALKAITQDDENLHLSGFRNANGEMIHRGAPSCFVMDGVAYVGNSEPQEATAVVLNNGNASENTQLGATLRRAAAKIVINIKQGKDVELHHYLETTDGSGNVTDIGTAEYIFYHLPITTNLLSSATAIVNPTMQSTAGEHDNDYSFIFSKDASHTDAMPNHNIQLIGYSYAYSWNTAEDATSLVVNLPMRWNEAGSSDYTTHEGWSARTQNWYRLPMTKANEFERNRLYEVNITVNVVGATSQSSAIVLEDVEFKTYDWIAQDISIGAMDDEPDYLMLNRDTVHIYNQNIDTDQLTFSSSAFIPATGVRVKQENVNGTQRKAIYYYNKFGQKTYLETINSEAAAAVTASAEQNVLNGGIVINSPIVPATQEQINQAIASLVKPSLPDVVMPTAPVEPEGKPQMPVEVVDPGVKPAEPNPADYVKATTTTSETTTSGNFTNRKQVETQTQTAYQYVTNGNGSVTFQVRTRTRTRERSYSFFGSAGEWNRDFENNPDSWWGSWSSWSADSAAQQEYDADLREYNEWDGKKAVYDQYLLDKATYDAELAVWMQSAAYQEYSVKKAAYDAEVVVYEQAMDAYQAQMDIYEQQKQDIISSMSAGEESHYNTIRYIEFEVENETGLKANFVVMQYPIIYITNQQGYFSYRSDFVSASGGEPVHYQNRVADYLTIAYWANSYTQRRSGNSWSKIDGSDSYGAVAGNQRSTYYADGKQLTSSGNSYYYEYTEGGTSYRKVFSSLSEIFTSDVLRSVYTSGSNIGKANLDEYYVNSNNGSSWSYADSKDPGNQRMYHVHVTATSGDYTVGRPRIVDANGNPTTDVENGQTDDSADNALLVSPSFMIASQLGVTQSVSSVSDSAYARAVNQCKNYVETYYDDLNSNNQWDTGEPVHHYKDWRLPTAEEIRIISELQGKENGAVDVVLAGRYYFCASPTKYVSGAGQSSGYFVRCIRDAY